MLPCEAICGGGIDYAMEMAGKVHDEAGYEMNCTRIQTNGAAYVPPAGRIPPQRCQRNFAAINVQTQANKGLLALGALIIIS